MRSKNKPSPTVTEAEWIAVVAELDCVVCDASHQSEVHEPEQGLWFASMPLCRLCHQAPHGWHGTRDRWKLRKMTELKAINQTVGRVYAVLRARRR